MTTARSIIYSNLTAAMYAIRRSHHISYIKLGCYLSHETRKVMGGGEIGVLPRMCVRFSCVPGNVKVTAGGGGCFFLLRAVRHDPL